MSRFPRHAALEMLLEQEQFEACRTVAERMIEELMLPPTVESLPQSQSVATVLASCQERDLELGYLHVLLSRCLHGLSDFEMAAIKADMAGLLARKANDLSLLAQATHLSGVCYSQAGNYRLAVQQLTRCLDHAEGLLRAKALYNRGHAYVRQGAHSFAVPDYEGALGLAIEFGPGLARNCRVNLAWTLILLKEFQRADAVLAEIAGEPGAESDRLVQVQMAHDRLHMAHLQGHDKDALRQVFEALRHCGQEYPHVRARIALTAMSIATSQGLPEQAVVLGVLSKRMAGKAKRPDLDDEASRRLQTLEVEAGTDCLAQSLQRMKQLMPGVTGPRKLSKRGHKIGGVG